MTDYMFRKRKTRRGKRKSRKKNKQITYNIHDFNNISFNTHNNTQLLFNNGNTNTIKTQKRKENNKQRNINVSTQMNIDINGTNTVININKHLLVKDVSYSDNIGYNNSNGNDKYVDRSNKSSNMEIENDLDDTMDDNFDDSNDKMDNNTVCDDDTGFDDDHKDLNDNDDADFGDDFDDDFEDNNDDWDDVKLEFGQQITSALNEDVDDPEQVLQRALNKKRQEMSDKNKFWTCGKCEFLNHPTQAVCMSCEMPQMDIIHHVLTCRDKLKTCPNCGSLIIPSQYEDHVDTCQPLLGVDGASWYCDLTLCEKNAINHVTAYAMSKSSMDTVEDELLKKIKSINSGYNDKTLKKLQMWLEWEVPMIIRIHVVKLIPLLLKDTHYRNLFEIGTGSGCNNQKTRKGHETKMFGDVYEHAKATERPKYGCLNVGLNAEGDTNAACYGDGYFILNNRTVRWRTTLTIQDSFSVNGNCGTLKHCLHLLNELNTNELQELIEAAILNKKGGKNQRYYREIQIHGPVLLNRDIISLHCPKTTLNSIDMFEKFCIKNGCNLVWF